MASYKDFITKVCNSIGVIALDENEPLVYMLPTEDGMESQPLLSKDKLPFYLPTFTNSKHLTKINKEGHSELSALLFSPVPEDSIKPETNAFSALKERISFKLNLAIYEVGYLLLNLVRDDKRIKTLGPDIERFLTNANKGETRGVRNLVDDDTFTKWTRICTKTKNIKNLQPLLVLSSVRNGRVGNERYKRLSAISFPLLEELTKLDRAIDNTVNGVRLRNKDLALFQAILEALTRNLSLDGFAYRVVSNNEDYSAFISLYSLYVDVMENIMSFAKRLEPIAEEGLTVFDTKLEIKADDIGELVEACRKEIDILPTERSLLIGQAITSNEQEIVSNNVGGVKIRDGVAKQNPGVKEYHEPVQPQNPQQPTQLDSSDVSNKAANMFNNPMGGFNNGIYPVVGSMVSPVVENPAASFITAMNGGFYSAPSIGNTGPNVPGVNGTFPVSTGVVGVNPNVGVFPAATVVSNYGGGVAMPGAMDVNMGGLGMVPGAGINTGLTPNLGLGVVPDPRMMPGMNMMNLGTQPGGGMMTQSPNKARGNIFR